MEFIKKVQAVILGLVVLLAFSCGKDDDGGTPGPEPQIPVQRVCKIVKIIDSGGDTIAYIYNSAGRVMRLNFLRLDPTTNYHQEITYNTAGNIAEIGFFDVNNIPEFHQRYSYNSQNLPDSITTINKSVAANHVVYEYDTNQKLVKSSTFHPNNPVPIDFREITYPTTNQTIEKLYTQNQAGALVLNTTTTTQYNTTKNPYTEMGFLNMSTLISQYCALSASTVNHLMGVTRNFSYAYINNSDGYHVQISAIPGQASQPTYITSYAYSCQ